MKFSHRILIPEVESFLTGKASTGENNNNETEEGSPINSVVAITP